MKTAVSALLHLKTAPVLTEWEINLMIRDPWLVKLEAIQDIKRRKQASKRRKQRNNRRYRRKSRYRYPMEKIVNEEKPRSSWKVFWVGVITILMITLITWIMR